MLLTIIAVAGVLLAYANGANDNFKGVATLFGSGTADYRPALRWATVTTLAGSLTALVLARGLLASFSGKGLVPDAILADPAFPAAVGLAAASTVLLATRLGYPVSTTHALIGGLVGAGCMAAGDIAWDRLGGGFVVPLLTSPLMAIVLAAVCYRPMRALRLRLGVGHQTCVCIGREIVATVPGAPGAAAAFQMVPSLSVDDQVVCRVRYQGRVLGVTVDRLLGFLHFASAGAVSFARGLNDTPKIAALLFAGGSLLSAPVALVSVGALIALGGLLSARRVAETMSHRIADMNPGQGLAGNLVTAVLVIGASNLGVPVSTTHVSCGALFGIGATTGNARWRTIIQIVWAWIITLPVAAGCGAVAMLLLRGL